MRHGGLDLASRRTVLRCAAAACCLAAPGVRARAEPPPAEVAGALPTARLIGQARMTWWGLRVYDARLWGPQPFEAGAYADQSFALVLHYLRALEGGAIAQRSLEEMRRIGPVDAERAERWLAAMRAAFPDVRAGDRLTGVHRPGGPVAFFSNGRPTAQVEPGEFARLFFGIWLSPRTSQPDLRARLLGLAPAEPSS